jgi:hypothetical protein
MVHQVEIVDEDEKSACQTMHFHDVSKLCECRLSTTCPKKRGETDK